MKILIKTQIIALLILAANASGYGQNSVYDLRWNKVATGMPDNWYGSDESKKIAENILLYQRNTGGWPKNIEKHKPLSEKDKEQLLKDKSNPDAIFDNSATTTEMRFLARMYKNTRDPLYRDSFIKGLEFILEAQYDNGGWPMFWPLRKGYYTHITFNDNAIINILSLLRDIKNRAGDFMDIIDNNSAARVSKAYEKGIGIILKTQIVVNGEPTVWCAQHDENTLLPAKARSYELPSFSGGESAGIVLFLMNINDPGPEIIRSVEGAVRWFEKHKLNNVKLEYFTNNEGLRDRRIASDPEAGSLWARFYDLDTGQPFFCDRDGVKKQTMQEIGYERRNGYSWYTDAPDDVLKLYPEWKNRVIKQKETDS